jgi:pilus assembly protein Flp/PilA
MPPVSFRFDPNRKNPELLGFVAPSSREPASASFENTPARARLERVNQLVVIRCYSGKAEEFRDVGTVLGATGKGTGMQKSLFMFFRDRSGATAIEYSLIAAFIGLAIIAGSRSIGESLSGIFPKVSGNLS